MVSILNPEKVFRKPKHDKNYFTCCIDGMRGSGKSVLTKYLYKSILKKLYDFTIIFTQPYSILEYEQILTNGSIFTQYDPEIIEKVKELNEKMFQEKGKYMKILIILDDVDDTKDVKMDEELEKLFKFGRHDHLSIIYIIHELKMLSTINRQNIDIIFFFNGKNKQSRQRLYELYLSGLAGDEDIPEGYTEKEFCDIMIKKICIDYWALAIVMGAGNTSNEFFDTVYRYKAPSKIKESK